MNVVNKEKCDDIMLAEIDSLAVNAQSKDKLKGRIGGLNSLR